MRKSDYPKTLVILMLVLSYGSFARAQQPSWSRIGPAPQHSGGTSGAVSGRVVAIAVSPSYTDSGVLKPAAMFIASEGGGLWKSEDFQSASPLWFPIIDNLFPQAQNIWSIAVSPNNPKIVYAGGDNGFLYSSQDRGATWIQIATGASSDFRGKITKIVIHPLTDEIYFSTQYTNSDSDNYTGGGVFKQTGNNFSPLNQGLPTETTIITDLDFTHDLAGKITLYLGTATKSGTASPESLGLWTYQETTGVWQHMPIALFDLKSQKSITASAKTFRDVRIACDHHPGAALGVYTAIRNGDSDTLLNVFKLVGDQWTVVGSPLKNFSLLSTFAALLLGLSETGDLYVGLGNVPQHAIYQSTDGGGHWSSIREGTNGLTPHVDERSIGFYSSKVYFGNDGGIYRFNALPNGKPGRSTWDSLNTPTLQTIMVNGIGIHPTDPNIILTGSQDNALALLIGGKWTQVFGGDNSKVLFDPDPLHQGKQAYTTGEENYKFFFRSDDGGVTWNDKSPEDANDQAGHQAAGINWYAPFSIHPANTQRVVVGIDRVYESFDKGETWGKQKSPIFKPTGTRPDGRAFGPQSTAIAYGLNDRIWVAYDEHIYVTENDGGDGSMANWNEVSQGVKFSGSIIQIRVDPRNPANVYLAVNNGSVWKSVKTATSWTWSNITGNFPSSVTLNTLCLAISGNVNPPTLFLGTKQGIFISFDEGASWGQFNTNLPVGNVTDIQYAPQTQTMIAGLYGRGIYKTSLALITQPNVVIDLPPNDCGIPSIEGSTIALSYAVNKQMNNLGWTVQWQVQGATPALGDTLKGSQFHIVIPVPAPEIIVSIDVHFSDGTTVSTSRKISTVTQEMAAVLTRVCELTKEHLKPRPWWEWDPARWVLDPSTNTMTTRPLTRAEAIQLIKIMQLDQHQLRRQAQNTETSHN